MANIEYGTIFKNTNPPHAAYFVFEKEMGRYSEGTVMENPNGYWELRSGTFRTDDLLSMSEMYPVVEKLEAVTLTVATILAALEDTFS